jgi:sn-glycerol 3-phosphate transport system permease protein
MLAKRVVFKNKWLPYALVAPQMLILAVFFFWPAGQAIYQSFFLSDPFGGAGIFVGLENFEILLASEEYWASVRVTLVFAVLTTALAMGMGLALAVFADRALRGVLVFKSAAIWPYAVAPVVAGALWVFLFHPVNGSVAALLLALGVPWDPLLNGTHAMILVVVAAAWKQISYNFVFFLAGLQAIPKSLIEAAAIDGAGPAVRFWRIALPLLSPTTFFLIVINTVYAFFETFGIIHAVTHGGPAGATNTLVFKVYTDGFEGQDLGSSAAQSVILMLMVIGLTMIQFRYVERKVTYA